MFISICIHVSLKTHNAGIDNAGFWIKPGITTTEEVFLDYNLVTVEWEVVETTIEDKYDIVLTATYETDVPAAVVVADPASISLPDMKAGDVFNGEITLTNHGLIRADKLNYSLPATDQYFKYELMAGIPDHLDAKERVTIPYRVTCLQPLVPSEDGTGSGGGCTNYEACGKIVYEFCCALGKILDKVELGACFTFQMCTSTGTGGGGGGGISVGGTWSIGGGVVSGTISTPSAGSTELAGVNQACYPDADKKECQNADECGKMVNCKDNEEEIWSSVNLVLREYQRDDHDFSVKVPGGTIDVKREFHGDTWYFEPMGIQLGSEVAANGKMSPDIQFYRYGTEEYGYITTAIFRRGVPYMLPADRFALRTEYGPFGGIISRKYVMTGAPVYIHGAYMLNGMVKDGALDGFKWEDIDGSWNTYKPDGFKTSVGNKTGTIGKVIFDHTDGKRVIGIADRYDNQVIWYEYGEDDHIAAVHDGNGRGVEYYYSNDLLTRVVDVRGNETLFEYQEIPRRRSLKDVIGDDGTSFMAVSYDGQNSGGSGGVSIQRPRYGINKVTDANGRERVMAYDDNGSIKSAKDSSGNGFDFEYNWDETKKEYWTQVKYASGRIKEVWFDENSETKRVAINGKVVKKIDKDGESRRNKQGKNSTFQS